MFPFRDRLIVCALCLAFVVGTAPAAEVSAELASCRKPFVSGYRSCYDPCEPVGPIRRFFRAVFRVPCPPPAPPVMVPVAVVRPVQPILAPAAPPVEVGRPTPVNPPLDVPPPTPPTSSRGMSVIPNQRTVPVPVRLDRLASLGTRGVEVTLVHATRGNLRLTSITDRDGTLTRDLAPGDWLVYTREHDGRFTYRGKVAAREGVPTRVFLD